MILYSLPLTHALTRDIELANLECKLPIRGKVCKGRQQFSLRARELRRNSLAVCRATCASESPLPAAIFQASLNPVSQNFPHDDTVL